MPGRKQGARNTSPEEVYQLNQLMRTGITQREAAERLGRSQAWVAKRLHGNSSSSYAKARSGKFDIPQPLFVDQLKALPKTCLDDFRLFRNTYFERETPDFQLEVCDRITNLGDDSLIALWPPGHGKSTLISHDYAVWRMLRARCYGQRFACLLLSKSEAMSRAFVTRIKRTLEHNEKLQAAYGWFKPEHPDLWTKGQLQVDGFDPEKQGKEPTFIAAGAGSHIYGWRVDLILADDLVDKDSSKKIERMADLQEWFHEEVESRLEKGGSLAVCGTRFSMHDLYGRLMALRDEDTEEPIYQVVRYAAHDDTKCPGNEGPHNAYPGGCLLWPTQKSFKWLMRERSKMGTGRFDFVYNQVESSTDENLLKSEWVEAAKDASRVLWHIPRGSRIVCTLDPSPTKYACAQAWAFDPNTKKRYLVAIERRRMNVGEMISLMENWTIRFREAGKEPRWFFERNAAQRWLLQSLDYKNLRQRTSINLQAHDTHRNKADPDYGVQVLAPLYEFGMVSLPWGDVASRAALAFFLTELAAYPQGQTDDGVMAEWFFEWNLRKVNRQMSNTYTESSWAPDYLKDSRKVTYLRPA